MIMQSGKKCQKVHSNTYFEPVITTIKSPDAGTKSSIFWYTVY